MTPVGSVGNFKRQLKKKPTWCEVADDPVVVSKSRPEKPGNRGEFLKIRMRSWRNARSHLASWSMPNSWLNDPGLFDLTTVETGVLPQKY